MHTHTFYIYFGAGSVEVLELQLAHVAAIHGVCPFATKLLYIKVVRAHANLLVGIESHADVAVLYLLVIAQIAHSLYYFGDTGFIVGT